MVTLDDINRKLNAILEMVDFRANNIPLTAQQIVTVEGLSDISKSLGLVQAGEFRAGNQRLPGDGFSGVRIGFPGFLYNTNLWHIAGVNNDVLQIGISATDGRLYAGAGDVIVDSDGIWIENQQAAFGFEDTNGDRFKIYLYSDSGDSLVLTNTTGASGTDGTVRVSVDTATHKVMYFFFKEDDATAEAPLFKVVNTNASYGHLGRIVLGTGIVLTSGIDGSETRFNDDSYNVDLRVKGETDGNLIFVDASLDAVGFGGVAESGYKVKVTGDLNITGWPYIDGAKFPFFLPFVNYEHLSSPISASPAYVYITSADRDVTFIDWVQDFYVFTTNNGSNYWTVELIRKSDGAVLNSFNTSAASASTWTRNTDSSFTSSTLTTAQLGMYCAVTKTGSPGNIALSGPLVKVHW